MCFERLTGSLRRNTKTRLCRFFSLANVVPPSIYVPRSAFSRMAGRAARRPAVSRQTKYGRPSCRTASRFFIIASPRYIQMLKRDASRQRPALPLPSLRLKEQRSRQPLGKTDGRRLSADSVRASVPPIRREGKSPSVRSYIPYTPADAQPATCRSRRSRCGYPQTRGRLHRHNAGGSARRSAAFPDCALMESDLPQYPFCSTPYTACSWVKPSNSSWSISPSREKEPERR